MIDVRQHEKTSERRALEFLHAMGDVNAIIMRVLSTTSSNDGKITTYACRLQTARGSVVKVTIKYDVNDRNIHDVAHYA